MARGETRVPWAAVFGNEHPVEFEIGPGRGDVLLALAAAAPGTNFFAVEHAARDAAAIMAKASARGLANVRVIAGDARCVVARLVAEASVAVYHIYFPDPWPKRRHRTRRLADPAFAAGLVRTLVRGGAVHLASDLRAVVEELTAALAAAGLVQVDAAEPPGRPTTAYERKYGRGGTHYARLARREE